MRDFTFREDEHGSRLTVDMDKVVNIEINLDREKAEYKIVVGCVGNNAFLSYLNSVDAVSSHDEFLMEWRKDGNT